MSGTPTNSGDRLRREWSIPARQTRYHKDGDFFMPLTSWPGALADPNGFVVFETEDDLKRCPGFSYRGVGTPNLRIGICGGIARFAHYVRKRPGSN